MSTETLNLRKKSRANNSMCNDLFQFHSIGKWMYIKDNFRQFIFNNYEVVAIVRHCFKNSTNILFVNLNNPMRRYHFPHLTEEETGTETLPKTLPKS